MAMYSGTSKLNSTFGTIGKATAVKMTAKVVGKGKFIIYDNGGWVDEDIETRSLKF